MITSPTGWVAVFGTGEDTRRLPVDDWNRDGEALVVNVQTGYRTIARYLDGFTGLDDAEPLVVAALPGAGWAIDYGQGEEPDPIVGWAVNAHGVATALGPDSDSQATPLWGCTGKLIPPGSRSNPPVEKFAPEHLGPELRAMYERGFKDGCGAVNSDF